MQSVAGDLAQVWVTFGPWTADGVLELCKGIYDEDPLLDRGNEDRGNEDALLDAGYHVVDGMDIFTSAMGMAWHLIPLEDIRTLRTLASGTGPNQYLGLLSQVVPRELDTLTRESFQDCLEHMDLMVLMDLPMDYHGRLLAVDSIPKARLKQITKHLTNLVGALRDLPRDPKGPVIERVPPIPPRVQSIPPRVQPPQPLRSSAFRVVSSEEDEPSSEED